MGNPVFSFLDWRFFSAFIAAVWPRDRQSRFQCRANLTFLLSRFNSLGAALGVK
jgi:hypothetical protein